MPCEVVTFHIEAHYGEGVMQRLRAGDSSDLAQDVTDRNRLQLVGAACLFPPISEPDME